MSVEARLDIQQRRGLRNRAQRRAIRLVASGERVSGAGFRALVHNISSTGLLLESAAQLEVGDTVAVALPETGKAKASVVWSNAPFYGCAFDAAISRAAISAAELQSPPSPAAPIPNQDALAAARAGEPLGSRIRRLRMAKGVSLVEFAEMMQVSRPTVWAWEAGKSYPRKSKLARLAKVLDFSEPAEETAGKAQLANDGPDLAGTPEVESIIFELKARVAALAGTSPDKVRLIIEV